MDLDDHPIGASCNARQCHRRDIPPMAGSMARVHEHRQMGLLLKDRDGVQVQREARGGLKGADPPFTQDNIGIPFAQNIFRRHQKLLDGRGHAALQEHGFGALRAPICSTSAYAATSSTSSGDITSVWMGRPVTALASASSFRASSPNPWNEYGEVRGLK